MTSNLLRWQFVSVVLGKKMSASRLSDIIQRFEVNKYSLIGRNIRERYFLCTCIHIPGIYKLTLSDRKDP